MAMDLPRWKRAQWICVAALFASVVATIGMPAYAGVWIAAFFVALVALIGVMGAIHRASPAAATKPERALATVALIALGIAVADALFSGPLLSALLMGFAALYYLPRALVAWGDWPRMRSRFAKGAVVFAIGLAAVELISWDARLGRERAGEVIAAVERYKAAKGTYPERLEALVPTYLPAVPRARFSPFASPFIYLRRPDGRDANLMYVVAPPFGRTVYDFEKRAWHALD